MPKEPQALVVVHESAGSQEGIWADTEGAIITFCLQLNGKLLMGNDLPAAHPERERSEEDTMNSQEGTGTSETHEKK